MKKTKIIMGMPVTVNIVEGKSSPKFIEVLKKVFTYFEFVDKKFSPFKKNSELSLINQNKIGPQDYSLEMHEVLRLCEQTNKESEGYFDIHTKKGMIDTSGIVKGWAILNASKIIDSCGFKNYFIDAGGDIQASGVNEKGKKWSIGIRNPFNKAQIVKVISASNMGVATSGNYERGLHILNPKTSKQADEIASITVVGENVYEADRFATAVFSMGKQGINFIEMRQGLEGYMIDKEGIATCTSGFEKYTSNV